MLKQILTYKDFDGNEVTETFWFHIFEDTLIEMELSHNSDGGLQGYLERISKANDVQAIYAEMKSLLKLSYGTRPGDGKEFVQTEEIYNKFKRTNAYTEMLFLLMDPVVSSAFVANIIPQDLDKRLEKLVAAGVIPSPTDPTKEQTVTDVVLPTDIPVWEKENRVPNQSELRTMTQAQLVAAFEKKSQK